jgi:predicted acyl esterase
VPYKYTIAVWPTSHEFSTGDRIRVEISSNDYPQFAPNPNTGEPFGQSAVTRPADQTILDDAAHPSSVTLPAIACAPSPYPRRRTT